MQNCVIKPIDAGMLAECAAVIRTGFGTVAAEFDLSEQNCPTNGAFMTTERLLADYQRGNVMYGLYDAQSLIGFLQLEKKSEQRVELKNITVLPQNRHSGFGKMLLDFACEEARKMGASCLTIGIIEENTVLKNWYAQYGFAHTGTRLFAHLPFTVGFMQYDL